LGDYDLIDQHINFQKNGQLLDILNDAGTQNFELYLQDGNQRLGFYNRTQNQWMLGMAYDGSYVNIPTDLKENNNRVATRVWSTLQNVTSQGNSTGNALQINGNENNSFSGQGLEMGYSTGIDKAYLQAYDRNQSQFLPFRILGSVITLEKGDVNITDGDIDLNGNNIINGDILNFEVRRSNQQNNNAGTSGWHKLGSIGGGTGDRFEIQILGASGFGQYKGGLGKTIIVGSFGNNSNSNVANIQGDFYNIGGDPLTNSIKFVEVDRFEYDVYVDLGKYTRHSVHVTGNPGIGWTDNFQTASAPGSESSTVQEVERRFRLQSPLQAEYDAYFLNNVSIQKTDPSEALDVDGNFQLSQNASNDFNNFVSGFAGSNWAIRDTGSNNWQLDIDDLYVRGALYANEFIINQILALNGSDILAPGRGKISSVSGSAPDETATVEDPQGNSVASFVENDIVIVQTVRPDNNQIVKRIVRKVASVSGNDVTLTSLADAPTDGGSLAEGDVMVAIGNTTNADRQASIYRTVIDSNNPYTIIQDGVASWDDWKSADKTKMKYGNLVGSYGYDSATHPNGIYGLAAGEPSGDHFTIDPTNGIRFRDGSFNVAARLSSNIFKIGDNTNYVSYNASTAAFDAKMNTFDLNANNGDLVVNSVDRVFAIQDGVFVAKTSSGNERAGISGTSYYPVNNTMIWAGDTVENRGLAPFRVQENGILHATGGTIGGINFSSNSLYTSNVSTDGGIKINWGNLPEFQMYDGVYSGEPKVHFDFTTAKLTQYERDSVYSADVGGLTSPELSITYYDKITGFVTIDITDGQADTEVDVVYEYEKPSGTWNEIDRYTHTGASSFTRYFDFTAIESNLNFRVRMVAVNVNLPTSASIGEYSAKQYFSQVKVNPKGMAFMGANLLMKSQPTNPNPESLGQLESGTIYFESDSNGNYYVKAKG
jgi:hypothetical protein